MGLTYPIVFYICIGIVAAGLIVLLFLIKGKKYTGGSRSANNDYVKKLSQYKTLILEYHFLRAGAIIGMILALIGASVLVAKPAVVKSEVTELHNRDIIIGFDVSTSLDSVSVQMCEQLQDFVSNLKGERFGIVIFNGQAVKLVPLTDDYGYVISELEHLKKSIEAGRNAMFYSDLDELSAYRFAGTSSDRGSSLIGDGLASCLYSFNDFEENPDRARLIVLVTDNDVLGDEIVTVPKACELCAFKKVKVFGIAPFFVEKEEEFKRSIESTGGKYFNTRNNDAIEDAIEAVKDTDVSVSYKTTTIKKDLPETFIILITLGTLLFGVTVWRLRL